MASPPLASWFCLLFRCKCPLFRSVKMTLVQLFLQSEAAYACVRELGELGKVQFRDLNPDVGGFQRKFVNEVRRCDEMERKLRFLSNEVEKAGIDVRSVGNIEAPDPQDMIDLEAKFEVLEAEVKEMNSNKATLKRNLLDLIELQHILGKTQVFFEEAEHYTLISAANLPSVLAEPGTSEDEARKGLLESVEEGQTVSAASPTKFTFVTGVIAHERLPAFERVLWRACRGNVFLRQAEIEDPLEDPSSGNQVYKVVFILFFQGEQLRTRVHKICEGFRATLYQCPETVTERREMTDAIRERIADLESVLQTTQDHRITQLQGIAQDIDIWQQKVKKIKAVFHVMNKFNLDMTQRCFIAECWCPEEDLEEIQQALNRGVEHSGSTVPNIFNEVTTTDNPPTLFKTDKYTRGFQTIVDAYGIPSYQEVNPTPFTIITFPFLFAVMFGDAGHGTLMALFAFMLILFEKRLERAGSGGGGGEIFHTIFAGRYIIFLMGVFSIYTGLVYNDVFSKSLNIFGSSWDPAFFNHTGQVPPGSTCCPEGTNCVITGTGENKVTIFPREAFNGKPYPFGIDPIWQTAENKLVFINSYKMKMSVILGITQMLFGVFLSIFNHFRFKHYISIFAEFIPQVLFLMCIFGWLVILIICKWSIFYNDPNTAPSLLITVINMFLEFSNSPKLTNATFSSKDNEYSVFGQTEKVTARQRIAQTNLVVLAVVCIPWMLFVKPIYLYVKHRRRTRMGEYRQVYNVTSGGEEDELLHYEEDQLVERENEEESFQLGEIFIHQTIHTIEYCLGTISNTASYLRLWALSLAHAELSEVLWLMVLQVGFGFGAENPALGAIIIFALFAFWAALTVFILLIMEGLSAFLHALRLHWVEFQNKFYVGDGYVFIPFSFERILSGEDDI